MRRLIARYHVVRIAGRWRDRRTGRYVSAAFAARSRAAQRAWAARRIVPPPVPPAPPPPAPLPVPPPVSPPAPPPIERLGPPDKVEKIAEWRAGWWCATWALEYPYSIRDERGITDVLRQALRHIGRRRDLYLVTLRFANGEWRSIAPAGAYAETAFAIVDAARYLQSRYLGLVPEDIGWDEIDMLAICYR